MIIQAKIPYEGFIALPQSSIRASHPKRTTAQAWRSEDFGGPIKVKARLLRFDAKC